MILNILVSYVSAGVCLYLFVLLVAWTLTWEDDEKIQDELREIMESQRGFWPLVFILTWPWTFIRAIRMCL